MAEESKGLDIFGVKPIAQAVETVTAGTVAGASAFLSRICLPAAEEFGLLIQDKVRGWRAKNAALIASKAEVKLGAQPETQDVHAHPRLVGLILEQGSWIEVDEIQEMWAGLLASSCTEDGLDDSNLMFADLLSRLSASQARILDHACRHAGKVVAPNGLIFVPFDGEVHIDLETLHSVSGVTDLHRLDRELDHLRGLELINPDGGGFNLNSPVPTADATPTTLALQMFARLSGYRGDPVPFFGLTQPENQADGS